MSMNKTEDRIESIAMFLGMIACAAIIVVCVIIMIELATGGGCDQTIVEVTTSDG